MNKKNIKTKKKKIIASLSLVFFFLVIIIAFFVINKTKETPTSENKNQEKTKSSLECRKDLQRHLDGVCLENSSKVNLWPIAVMIDNHPDAWPQYGVSQANLVFNTLVEGSATRLMAVFVVEEGDFKIGPVRSARPYFLDWVMGLNALYTHAGGSPEALEEIKENNVLDLNEITSYGPLYFERDNSKNAPHNLFTSLKKIDLAREDWNLRQEKPSYNPWMFSFTPSPSKKNIEQIKINYSKSDLFKIKYKYSTSTQNFLRYQNQKPHTDAGNKQQIKVDNLIIQKVEKEIHLDTEDRLKINTLGQGKALIFINGKQIEASWKKEDKKSRTVFFNKAGEEIVFKPGSIWVEIVPEGREIQID